MSPKLIFVLYYNVDSLEELKHLATNTVGENGMYAVKFFFVIFCL